MKREKNKSKKTKIGTLAKILVLIIVTPIFIMSAVIMVKANMYPDKIPDIMGYKPMIVLSGSMETSIYTGDLVFVKMVDIDILKENDVIAFRNEANTVTTHRIIEIIEENGEELFRTKGDNNNAEDANLVKSGDIEGVYLFRIPKLGKMLMLLKEPTTLAVILLGILVVGLIWLHILDKKENKENEAYRKEFEEFKRRQQVESKK